MSERELTEQQPLRTSTRLPARAVEAVAACCGEWRLSSPSSISTPSSTSRPSDKRKITYNDLIPHPKPPHLPAHLIHDPRELMPDNKPRGHLYVAAIEMQVAPADRGGFHLHDYVFGVEDRRRRPLFYRDFFDAFEDDGAHCCWAGGCGGHFFGCVIHVGVGDVGEELRNGEKE